MSILRRVKHPNIIMLVEEMETATELFLVMELVKVRMGGLVGVKSQSVNTPEEPCQKSILYIRVRHIRLMHGPFFI